MNPSSGDAPTVDRDRLRRSFEDLSTFGATTNGGLHRVALTDADRDVRRRLVEMCDEADFDVTVDRVGSIFATRRALNADAPPLLIGSHLDSQPHGGRYDGAVGVVAAFEVMRRLDDLGMDTACPVQLVN